MSIDVERMRSGFKADIPQSVVASQPVFEDCNIKELLRWRDSSSVDADELSRIEATLSMRVGMHPQKELSDALEVYLQVRQTAAANTALRRLVFLTKNKVSGATDPQEIFGELEGVPRSHEAPEFRLLVRRLIGEKFFQKEE